jgi:hypothetical protein
MTTISSNFGVAIQLRRPSSLRRGRPGAARWLRFEGDMVTLVVAMPVSQAAMPVTTIAEEKPNFGSNV